MCGTSAIYFVDRNFKIWMERIFSYKKTISGFGLFVICNMRTELYPG